MHAPCRPWPCRAHGTRGADSRKNGPHDGRIADRLTRIGVETTFRQLRTQPNQGVVPTARPTLRRPAHTADSHAAEPEALGPELTAAEVEARFRWARSRGHPSYVWREVPVAEWRAALVDVERATAAVLAGGPARFERRASLSPGAHAVAAFTSGLGPLLGHWAEAGALEVEAGLEPLLRAHLAHSRRRASRMEWELHRLLGVLAAAGVEPTIVKGAHTSRAYFPDPATRPAADLDLVVVPASLAAATAALRAAGYVERIEQRRPYKADWQPPDAPATVRSIWFNHEENPFAIELHSTLERDFCGIRRVTVADGEEGTEPWRAVPGNARVLAQPWLTAYLALHASEALQNLTLLRVLELVLAIRQDIGTTLQWGALLDLLVDRGALGYAYPALALAERLAPGTVDGGALESMRAAAPRRVRAVLSRISPATAYRPERISLEERFMWAVGAADHVRRAFRSLWPIAGGGSVRRLARIYRDRAWELARGVVSIRDEAPTAGDAA